MRVDPKLDYLINMCINILHVEVKIYDDNECLIKDYALKKSNSDWLLSDEALRKLLIKNATLQQVYLYADNTNIIFAAIKIQHYVVIFGPINTGSHPDFNLNILYASKHHCEPSLIPIAEIRELISVILMLNANCNQTFISIDDVIAKSFLTNDLILKINNRAIEIVTHQIDEGQPHNPIIYEKNLNEAIVLGDDNALAEAQSRSYAGKRGILAKDKVRSAKNLGIIDISLAARASILGGVDAEEAYIVADSFILELEESKNIQDINLLVSLAQQKFTHMVAKLKNTYNDSKRNDEQDKISLSQQVILDKVKNYIKRNINNKITIKTLCLKTEISSTYLQIIFKKAYNCTVMDFIRHEKIRVAKYLLRFTNYSLSEIADSLSFSSQSHFTQVFKKENGITPEQYRNSEVIPQ